MDDAMGQSGDDLLRRTSEDLRLSKQSVNGRRGNFTFCLL
jgi:hypothetical protein